VPQQQKDKRGGEALSWPMLLALAWGVGWVGGREGGSSAHIIPNSRLVRPRKSAVVP
jgi:hypothetical protein